MAQKMRVEVREQRSAKLPVEAVFRHDDVADVVVTVGERNVHISLIDDTLSVYGAIKAVTTKRYADGLLLELF